MVRKPSRSATFFPKRLIDVIAIVFRPFTRDGSIGKIQFRFWQQIFKGVTLCRMDRIFPRRKRLCRRLRKWLRWFRRRRLGYRRFQWRRLRKPLRPREAPGRFMRIKGFWCGGVSLGCQRRCGRVRFFLSLPGGLGGLCGRFFLFLLFCFCQAPSIARGGLRPLVARSRLLRFLERQPARLRAPRGRWAETASSCHRFQRVGRRLRGRFLRLLRKG